MDELSRKIDSLIRTVNKYGKYIEELEKDVAILKKDSHPPIFGVKDKYNIIERLKKLEKGDK
tara:strand:- start:297 stop:482 length:186 start_codon:yes stop_codon:yes gene_type:complete